jgi:hypothetical protein
MKIDAYTKAVLTVIAACLVWMCVTRVTPVARAQAGLPQPTAVVLVDAKGTPLNTQDGLRVSLDTKALPVVIANVPVPVEVSNTSLNVSVRALQRTGAWDPIQVQVLREPPTLRPVP